MKKFTLIFVATLMFSNVHVAQSCLEAGITLHDQQSIDNFPADYPDCIEILGDVTIGLGYDNDITDLSGLSNIQHIEGFLYLQENPNLENLDGLDALESIGGYLEIYGNASLNSLSGLVALETIGGDLIFYENHELVNFSGLDALTSVGGVMEIGYHESLNSFTGLGSLTGVGGIDMAYVSNLTDFSGLNALGSINGNVLLASCEGISSTNGLNVLTTVSGDLFLNGLVSLASLTGLENLNTIGGQLRLLSSPVVDLTPLGNLTSVGGSLEISGCNALTDLSGLQGLISIGGELVIGSNQSLATLSGINNIAPQSITNLAIRYNPLLSACETESVCNYLLAPGGTIWIFDNAEGCNSQEEVESACEGTSIQEFNPNIKLKVHPNPFSNELQFNYHLEETQHVKIILYNQLGMMVDLTEVYQSKGENSLMLSLSDLPEGVYHYSVQTAMSVYSGKVYRRAE